MAVSARDRGTQLLSLSLGRVRESRLLRCAALDALPVLIVTLVTKSLCLDQVWPLSEEVDWTLQTACSS
jgi:hypothetical protein